MFGDSIASPEDSNWIDQNNGKNCIVLYYNTKITPADAGEKKEMENSGISKVEQLKEIFPRVSQDFLKGLCEAYSEEELDIDELVEVVLSFECPPLDEESAETNLQDAQAISNNSVNQQIVPENLDNSQLQVISTTGTNSDASVIGCVVLFGSPAEITILDDKSDSIVDLNSSLETTVDLDCSAISTFESKHQDIIQENILADADSFCFENKTEDPIVAESVLPVSCEEKNIDIVQSKIASTELSVPSISKVIGTGINLSCSRSNETIGSETSFPTDEADFSTENNDMSSILSDIFNEVEDVVMIPENDPRNDCKETLENVLNLDDVTNKNFESSEEDKVFKQNNACKNESSSSNELLSETDSCTETKSHITIENSKNDSLQSVKDGINNEDEVSSTLLTTAYNGLNTVGSSEKSKTISEILVIASQCATDDKIPSTQLKNEPPSKIEYQIQPLPCFNKRAKGLQSRKSNSATSNQSQSLRYCSSKKPQLRSCKIKNDEMRLRMKLVHQYSPIRTTLAKKVKDRNSSTNVNSYSQFESAESKLSLLQKILPDADQDYLIAESEKITSHEELLLFISKSIDNQDYPKQENLQKQEEAKMMDRFECTVEDFLRDIPDPEAEFSSNSYIRTGYEENAEIYLQSRYANLDLEIIKQYLQVNNYNLTEVCKHLEAEGQTANPYVLDNLRLHHAPSIFFHQEVWFIEHKTKVKEFLNSVIEAIRIQDEMNQPPTPPPVEEVFECSICSEDIVEYSQLGTCDGPGGHLFCLNCIRRNTEVKIGEGITTFPCLTNCGGIIPLQTVQEVLPEQMFSKLMEKIQEAEVRAANIPGIEECPFCPYAYGPEENNLFICANSSCMKVSCRLCRKEDHSPDICAMLKEQDEEAARHLVENRMTEALMRVCYNCSKPFVKIDGCNKMTCGCGAKMCYLCRQPVVDYSHFNGPDGDNTNRCELYSDDKTIHDQPVALMAQQAFNDIMANNPGLNLDPNKIIPK